jgi:hypothetical protein
MSDQIQEIVKALNETYPTAEFSFGYLFNHPCPVERQQWYIFTQVPRAKDGAYWGHPFPNRHRYSCSGAGRMDQILKDLESPRFQKWLRDLREDIGSSRHTWWHQKTHANDCPECGRKPNSTGVQRVSETEKVGFFSRYDGVRYREVNNCLHCRIKYPRVA